MGCNEENRPRRWTSNDHDVLLAAVYKNDTATLDYLLEHNVDLNCRNHVGETRLHIVIRRNDSPALIERLLDLGCEINIATEYGKTPLHLAILMENVEIAQKLIELGADLDVQDLNNRWTPLFYAIWKCNIEAVCMLLYYGADVTIKNAENYTPLTYAIVNYRQDVMPILLDYCDDFNYRDNDGYTPLHLVMVRKCESDLAIRLIDAGAAVNAVTNHGYCALEFAMNLAGADVFKKIWGRMNIDIVPEIRFPLIFTYIKSAWQYSANEWVECLSLMLESPIAVDPIDQCTMYCTSPDYLRNSFITELLYSLQKHNVTSRDRQNIINICVTLGAEVTVTNLDVAIELYGFNEELNTLVYATEHYRNEDIHHPLLPLIISLSDFNFLKMIWWCRKYIKARLPQYDELVDYIIVSCLGFFSLTPFWKQELLQECQWNSRSEYKFVRKIEAAREFPSLLELSRNKAHSLVRKMCKAKKPYQLHDAVKSLPLPGTLIDLLLFKRPLYRQPD